MVLPRWPAVKGGSNGSFRRTLYRLVRPQDFWTEERWLGETGAAHRSETWGQSVPIVLCWGGANQMSSFQTDQIQVLVANELNPDLTGLFYTPVALNIWSITIQRWHHHTITIMDSWDKQLAAASIKNKQNNPSSMGRKDRSARTVKNKGATEPLTHVPA